MALCRGFAVVKGRANRHAQKCGAVPEHDGYCVVHLKAAGYARCEVCRAWRSPDSVARGFACAMCDAGATRPRPSLPMVGTAVEEGIIEQDGDQCCEHGVALDVHCCGDGRPGGCHTGFFPPDACRCYEPRQPLDARAHTDGDDAAREAGAYEPFTGPTPACPHCESAKQVRQVAAPAHVAAPLWSCATCAREFQIPF
jgi:hypothetical protein